ncbi:MAG: hypothetical protein JSR77_02780 [Planctomycetes bacterium]|nr:hypothetical protein [Planctomycetota bacterium]
MHTRSPVVAAAVSASLAVTFASARVAGTYAYTIDPALSGLAATLDSSIATTGTLIGDYSDTNTAGTRTKPGLFGTFGATENVAVNVGLGAQIRGPLNTDTSGGFTLDVDGTNGTARIRDYRANFVNGGTLQVPISISLSPESFRTRSPSSTYPGVPVTLPIGQATVSAFSVQQVGEGLGTVTKTGPNTYDFTLVPIVQLTLTVSVLGNEFTLPGTPTAFPLAGSVAFNGVTSTLTSMQPVNFSQSAMPNQTLPQFPLALPTVLPPGGTANVLMDLILTDISATLTGDLTTGAQGTLVPAPATLALLLPALHAGRRRRTR